MIIGDIIIFAIIIAIVTAVDLSNRTLDESAAELLYYDENGSNESVSDAATETQQVSEVKLTDDSNSIKDVMSDIEAQIGEEKLEDVPIEIMEASTTSQQRESGVPENRADTESFSTIEVTTDSVNPELWGAIEVSSSGEPVGREIKTPERTKAKEHVSLGDLARQGTYKSAKRNAFNVSDMGEDEREKRRAAIRARRAAREQEMLDKGASKPKANDGLKSKKDSIMQNSPDVHSLDDIGMHDDFDGDGLGLGDIISRSLEDLK